MSGLQSVVGIFAHPDDETILMGGMAAMLSAQGVAVTLVCATRGEGGELGEPPVTERALLGSVREAELRCAASAVGASAEFLAYVDPLIGENDSLFAFECDYDTLVSEIVTLARERRADVILTHGTDGEYGHPAHILLNRAVMSAAASSLRDTLIYTTAATIPGQEDRIWNKSDAAHVVYDIGAWADAKLAAMTCHLSQRALFLRRRELTEVSQALRTIETFRRAWPATTSGEVPQDIFAQALYAAGASTPASLSDESGSSIPG